MVSSYIQMHVNLNLFREVVKCVKLYMSKMEDIERALKTPKKPEGNKKDKDVVQVQEDWLGEIEKTIKSKLTTIDFKLYSLEEINVGFKMSLE